METCSLAVGIKCRWEKEEGKVSFVAFTTSDDEKTSQEWLKLFRLGIIDSKAWMMADMIFRSPWATNLRDFWLCVDDFTESPTAKKRYQPT